MRSTLNAWAKDIHDNAINHGWWETQRPVPELLCLIHSEVSEALEAYREDEFDLLAEELADIIIRTLDMAAGLNIDIGGEVLRKHRININRPYRHGGKRC